MTTSNEAKAQRADAVNHLRSLAQSRLEIGATLLNSGEVVEGEKSVAQATAYMQAAFHIVNGEHRS